VGRRGGEPKTTLNTGNVVEERTVREEGRI
jgi:hypothetical protein